MMNEKFYEYSSGEEAWESASDPETGLHRPRKTEGKTKPLKKKRITPAPIGELAVM